MQTIILILVQVFLYNAIIAQSPLMRKDWHSCLEKELKGRVKSWKMLSEGQIVRQQEYNQDGKLTNDTKRNRVIPYLFAERRPMVLKDRFEKVFSKEERNQPKGFRYKYNPRGQLVEQLRPGKKDNYHLKNTFNSTGLLLSSMEKRTMTATRAWNSTHHKEPTYEVRIFEQSIARYKYNRAGLIAEFQYLHSRISKSFRILYNYDEQHNLIETLRYDDSNIGILKYSDNYLNNYLLQSAPASFWNKGTPARETWTYNAQNKKIEHMVYGYMDGPSFKATWEYDSDGKLLKEVHHDVYHHTLRAELWFDEQGNVIKEIDYDYWADSQNTFYYEIEYYN